MLSGAIADGCCDVETVDQVNTRHFLPILHELTKRCGACRRWTRGAPEGGPPVEVNAAVAVMAARVASKALAPPARHGAAASGAARRCAARVYNIAFPGSTLTSLLP